jgi:hypothetical protein
MMAFIFEKYFEKSFPLPDRAKFIVNSTWFWED